MLGILCGLESEAAIARRINGATVVYSAANPDKARQGAHQLVSQGATILISFGLAGGLKPGLPSGDFIIGTSIYAPGRRWECDEEWIDELTRTFPKGWRAPVWASETIILKARDKRILHDETGCYAADMESRAVAEMAEAARLPFAVFRAIADTADMDLPPAAAVPLRDDGRVNKAKVFLNILRHPLQISGLVRIGLGTAQAMKKLQAAAERIKG